jgi:hypothetical protein
MDLDGLLMQEHFHSAPVGYISNDFDVNKFEWEEEEHRISNAVSSNSNESDNDQGGIDAMPTPVAPIPVPVHAMPLPIPTELLHAMPTQGRLVIDLPEDDTPMIHGVGLAKHSSTFHHHLHSDRAYVIEAG